LIIEGMFRRVDNVMKKEKFSQTSAEGEEESEEK
jgi:hypothetical protein